MPSLTDSQSKAFLNSREHLICGNAFLAGIGRGDSFLQYAHRVREVSLVNKRRSSLFENNGADIWKIQDLPAADDRVVSAIGLLLLELNGKSRP